MNYELLKINVGDKYRLKKKHPCGCFDFEVIRSGADCKLKCLKCDHVIMLDRIDLKKSIKEIIYKVEDKIPEIDFLTKHNNSLESFDCTNIDKYLNEEIEKGLISKSTLPMIPTYLNTEVKIKEDEKVLLLDLGGTNLRVSIGYYKNNTPIIEEKLKTSMIGAESEVTKKEFFDTLYSYIEPYLDDVKRIGMCFSYQAEIDSNLEGTLLSWSKEIKAPEVVGCNINKELNKLIKEHKGYTLPIVQLNDTCACLLGSIDLNKEYSSYIGMIYGTGFNVCYIEKTSNIKRVKEYKSDSMLINTESAQFSRIPLGDFDREAISKSLNPSDSILEKITSGKYLDDVINTALKHAYSEGVIKEEKEFNDLVDASLYLSEGLNDSVSIIIKNLVERAAKVLSYVLNTYINKTYKINKSKVALAVEGSTFYKLPYFKDTFLKYLNELNNNFEFIDARDVNLKGALYSSFIKD